MSLSSTIEAPFQTRLYHPARDRETVIGLIAQLARHEISLGTPRDQRKETLSASLDDDARKVRLWGGEQRVSILGNEVIGYIAMTLAEAGPLTPLDMRHHVFIETLIVAQNYRGKGVGKSLLASAEELARLHNYSAISLAMVPGNRAAEALYLKSGFKPAAIEMRKTLD